MKKLNFKLTAKKELKKKIKKGLKGFDNCYKYLEINFQNTLTHDDKIDILTEIL